MSEGTLETSYTKAFAKQSPGYHFSFVLKRFIFAALLHARRVPDVVSPACQFGWRRHDPKHVVIFCPDRARDHQKLYKTAGTDKYQEILSTGKRLRAVAQWVVSECLLSRTSLAREQSDWVEGNGKGNGGRG